MLLRRITKHVTEQNWFAVFIDFLIVVLGILIAFQITNWGEAQQDKQLSVEYQKRLLVDLNKRIELLESMSAYYEITYKHANDAAMAYVERPDDLGVEFLIDLYQASQRLNNLVSKGIYDELLSTGRINLIGDQTLRDQLSTYYSDYDGWMIAVVAQGNYRPKVRMELDFRIQQQIRQQCGDYFVASSLNISLTKLHQSCTLDIANELIEQDVSKLLANQEIEQLLRFQIDMIYIRSQNLGAIMKATKALKVNIEKL
jgi:hypothetical protein